FVPQQPWKSAWLGLDGSLPRSVPMDAIVSVLTQAVPGSVVQRVFLVSAFLLGGLGISRLAGERSWAARAAAVTFFVWNPWVHDHLQIGQWAILCGYLALPWVALAARRYRADVRRGWAPVAVALVVSAICSPSSGVMAVVVVAVLGLRLVWSSWAVLAVLALVANLSWLLPSLLARSSTVTTAGVFDLFAPRAESSLGVLGSLLSMGGTWKTSIVAGERTSAVVVALACAVTVTALAGARRLRHDVRAPEVRRLALLAALSLAVAAVPGLGGGDSYAWLGEQVPALALLRDAQRFLAPAALLLAVGLASAVSGVLAQVRPGRESFAGVAGLLVLAPVLLLPSLAWGSGLERSSYPSDWDAAGSLIEAEAHTTTVVLPWTGSYRRFDWTGGRAVLDPAPRYLPGDVLIDDRTFVDGVEIGSEDPRVQRVEAALDLDQEAQAPALRSLGVRWVLLELDQGSAPPPEGVEVFVGEHLVLLDLGEIDARLAQSVLASSHKDQVGLVTSGHLGAFGLLGVAVARILLPGSNRHHR
uniref:hypothetical protein n=1 Tax=Nocardioides sp. TaxID=35761 RepID=UPI002B276BF4